MPCVENSSRIDWFSPVSCRICGEKFENVSALINHINCHFEMSTNGKGAMTPSSFTMGRNYSSPPPSSRSFQYSPPSLFQQSLLSPPSFSLADSINRSLTNTRSSCRPALSSTLAIQKPKSPFIGADRFSVMETPPTLYNVKLYNRAANQYVLSDGVTRPFIHQLDRPVPVIIELEDDEAEDNNDPSLDLALKL